MAQDWQIDGPKVLDIGGEGEAVRKLKVGLVAGRVDIVTHDDSPTARLEVHSVSGKPLLVTWDGSTLKVSHVKDKEGNLWESLKRFSKEHERLNARLSLSVPSGDRRRGQHRQRRGAGVRRARRRQGQHRQRLADPRRHRAATWTPTP